MRALSIELEDETVDALEAERELFGFESRQAYVRWIIANRGSIEADREPDHEAKQDRVLADHSKRLARLEERVSAIAEGLEGEDGDLEREDSGEVATETTGGNEDNGHDTTGGRNSADGDDTSTVRSRVADRRNRTAEHESPLEVRGAPRTVRQGPDSTIRADDEAETGASTRAGGCGGEPSGDEAPGSEPDADSSSNGSSEASTDAESSGRLTPERVARIREDPVHEDAGVLGSVESERLDELSRRAVATTRKRLNRDVQTGLEYTSSTGLSGDGVRPGEDITDLDALSIPGRSAETVEKRRHAVGRALAYLRDENRARRSDFVEALYTECPAGYETADSWWGCIKEGLKQVEAVDGGEGTRVWRYRG